MNTLRARDLKQMLDRDDDMLTINVLAKEDFDKEHIPGSTNVPVTTPDFATAVGRLAGAKDRTVVVYCASRKCSASPRAARKLIDAGFTNVVDFEGGMAEWKLAGYPVELGAAAGAAR